jgi:alpha-tubulin suppressor-like RCC1 family protein
MSTKNVFRLNKVYDLIATGQIQYTGANELTLFSWGRNTSYGRVGDNTTVNRSSPVQIPGTSWNRIEAAGQSERVLATKCDGTLWAWGQNGGGQLGDSTTIHKSSPIQIPGTSWSQLATGGAAHALKTDGTLWSWGPNSFGKLGDNTTVDKSSPIQIPGTAWCAIQSHDNHTLALKTDGTLWAWGFSSFGSGYPNNGGRLGDSAFIHRSSPVQVPGTSWVEVSAGSSHSVARKSDGTLWSWGGDAAGRLGVNTSDLGKNSPVQVPGTTWNNIAAATAHTFALKTDGSLWTWGGNYAGTLGLNDLAHRSSPVQIPGSWADMAGGNQHSVARKTNGTLWTWGCAVCGALGDDTIINKSSPVQIPGTSWFRVCNGTNLTLATKCTVL